MTLYPTLVGGGFGRNFEVAAIEQAVACAREVKRPVQLVWSRGEDIAHDPMRPPALARMTARVSGAGLLGWLRETALTHGSISAPDLDMFTITDDLDEAVATVVSSPAPPPAERPE